MLQKGQTFRQASTRMSNLVVSKLSFSLFKELIWQVLGLLSWETYMQVRKQQLELDMEQQTDSK